jgi:hypothetical protein
LLAALGVFFALFISPPGHLSVDEGVYPLMVRNLSLSGSLEIWNGYEEFPSRELVFDAVYAHEGRLVPQYPYLYPVLVLPFYRLAGYHGLFIFNALAYLGVMALCVALARRLFRDRDLAFNACLLFVLATFSWEYSQAAWPHAVSMLFTTAAVYLAVAALGAGVRYDVVFVLPAVVLPFLFARPWRPWQALAAGIGTVPGLALLAATNFVKFGIASPFTYGPGAKGATSGPEPYLPLLVFAVLALLGLWLLTRPRVRALLPPGRWTVPAVLVVLGGALSLTLHGWDVISRLANGTYQLVVDLRTRDPSIVEGALARSPAGALIYFGGVKKTLLQSCPYLVVLLVPLVELARGTKDRLSLSVLFLVPATFVATYAYFSWHGGGSLNMRYLTPILPFTSVLTAYAWRGLTRDLSGTWQNVALAAGVATFVGFGWVVFRRPITIEEQELVFLTLPLMLALLLFALLVARMVTGDRAGPVVRGTVAAVLVTAFVWSGLGAFSHDYLRSLWMRHASTEMAQAGARLVAPDSIVFLRALHPLSGYFEKDGVRFAVPWYDDFQDFRPLVDFHLDAGRSVYVWIGPFFSHIDSQRNLLDSLEVVPLFEHPFATLVQIVRPPATREP